MDNKVSHNNYLLAKYFTVLGYAIALEDNELLPVEIEAINKYINERFFLTPDEELELQNEIKNFVNEININYKEIINNLLVKLDDYSKIQLASYLIAIAASDGVLKICELKILYKIFQKLNISEEYLKSALDNLINVTDNLVTLQYEEKSPKKGSLIPKPTIEYPSNSIEKDNNGLTNIDDKTTNREDNNEKESQDETLILNKSKIEEILKNSEISDKILSEFFGITIEEKEKQDIPNNNNGLGQFDREELINNIVKILIKKEIWTRKEFLDIIRGASILPNMLISEINEWAVDNYGDFLIEEDGDKLKIIIEVSKQIS